jgi:predicted hydrolase (HD superfamily)
MIDRSSQLNDYIYSNNDNDDEARWWVVGDIYFIGFDLDYVTTHKQEKIQENKTMIVKHKDIKLGCNVLSSGQLSYCTDFLPRLPS